MDVRNRGFNGLRGPEVPIITSAFLPKSKTVSSRPFQYRYTESDRIVSDRKDRPDIEDSRCKMQDAKFWKSTSFTVVSV